MVQYQQGLDGVFAALADPTRRTILQRLGRGSATVSELAEPFGMSLTGAKKHVSVLERAGLVSTEKVGRSRLCSLGPRRLDDVGTWIAAYGQMLEERMDRLGELLQQRSGQPSPASAGPQERRRRQGQPTMTRRRR
jgi:DNA-binding transcriptional ArsR family regulator